MSQVRPQPRINVPAVCSFVCLAAQALWVALCNVFVSQSDPANWLAGLAGLLGAGLGVCVLSAVGTAFGVAGRRSGWGILALTLNALLFLSTGIALLTFFGPLR